MKIQVIVGSTRPGRITRRIAQWVANQAEALPDIKVELVDLADYPMPFLDEPMSPQFNPDRQPNDAAKKWLDKLAEADGYVIVTPEYNRSFSAVLKNALDYIDFQFAQKPVALVAHGSTGGAQAIAGLRITLPGLQTVSVPQATFLLDNFGQKVDDDGQPAEDISRYEGALKMTLDSLAWYTKALKAARD